MRGRSTTTVPRCVPTHASQQFVALALSLPIGYCCCCCCVTSSFLLSSSRRRRRRRGNDTVVSPAGQCQTAGGNTTRHVRGRHGSCPRIFAVQSLPLAVVVYGGQLREEFQQFLVVGTRRRWHMYTSGWLGGGDSRCGIQRSERRVHGASRENATNRGGGGAIATGLGRHASRTVLQANLLCRAVRIRSKKNLIFILSEIICALFSR